MCIAMESKITTAENPRTELFRLFSQEKSLHHLYGQTRAIQINLVYLHSVVIDFELCLSLSVGDNPRWVPAPESLLQVQRQH